MSRWPSLLRSLQRPGGDTEALVVTLSARSPRSPRSPDVARTSIQEDRRHERTAAVARNSSLLAWFVKNGRELVVRSTAEPWPTLVAEVMSHQTQIARVGPAWASFVRRWPTPESLSTAPTGELLRAWAGLGYNRRALALREAARRIVAEHGGEVPADLRALERLPGVGPYTARAVAASCFGVPVAPLDVNVRRVVARMLGCEDDRDLQDGADALVSRAQPRDWAHAIMDLAAAVCTRRDPRCGDCPIAAWCASVGTVGEVGRATRASGGLSLAHQSAPFERTRRWLRGRIVARLRDAGANAWIDFDEPIGSHALSNVQAALEGLAHDGFVQVDGLRARLV